MLPISEVEIAKWKERLEKLKDSKIFEDLQKVIYEKFKAHRRVTGVRLIRFVSPRTEIKSINSVIDKIKRNRKKQSKDERPYDFDDIEDLAGIKVLCPYPSSAMEVMKWMFKQTTDFKVKPTSIKAAWQTNESGYRGWHFIAKPSISSHPNLQGAKCEVQVKTMLQESWDAQTHDFSFKKEEWIDKGLLDHLKSQSDILTALDQQSEIIRELIERTEEEEREHKRFATMHYLLLLVPSKLFDNCLDRCGLDLQDSEFFPLSSNNLTTVNGVIDNYRKKEGLNKDLIKFAAFVALSQGEVEQEEKALSLARDFLNAEPENPVAEDIIAGVYWALNRFDEAIKHGIEAIKKAKVLGKDIDSYKDNFCYWVAEAVRAHMDVSAQNRTQTQEWSEDLCNSHSTDTKYLDTAAFVKIALGTNKEEIESGLELLKKVRYLAKEKEISEETRKMVSIFCNRHEMLAYSKISQLCQLNKT